MTPYSSLTPAQRQQVAELFLDDVFGNDPTAFEYLIQDGNVTGRAKVTTPISAARARKARNIRATVTVREAPGTADDQRAARYVIQSIARSVVERIHFAEV